jgi:acetyl esterase
MSDDAPFIDPELIAAGQLLKSHGLAALNPASSPIEDVRAMQDRIGAFLGEGSTPLQRERDLTILGPHGVVPCRLYLPDGVERPPVLVYAHGGSFAGGSLASWDAMLRELVRGSGVAVLSVDYRLAPEHRFPIAFDEMVAAIRFAARKGSLLGVDGTRVAAGGDSAGANLALAAALALRDAQEPVLSFLLLIYGVYSTDGDSESWRRLGTGTYGLSRAQLSWIWENYLASPEPRSDYRVAPLLAKLDGLPPAHLMIGSLDPLLDDNHALAARLEEVGVPHHLTIYEGINHGFIRYGRLIATARRAVADCAAALRRALSV